MTETLTDKLAAALRIAQQHSPCPLYADALRAYDEAKANEIVMRGRHHPAFRNVMMCICGLPMKDHPKKELVPIFDNGDAPAVYSAPRSDRETIAKESSDLVKRLREAGNIGADLSPGDPLCAEAADRIEALQHELEYLREQVKQPEYPCSPHCAGYLRELALHNG